MLCQNVVGEGVYSTILADSAVVDAAANTLHIFIWKFSNWRLHMYETGHRYSSFSLMQH